MQKTIRLDAYVIDTLMRDLRGHDRSASAFLVYLALWRAKGKRPVAMSHARLAEATGLSKRSVQNAVAILRRRRLVGVEKSGATEAGRYTVKTPWRR